MLNNFEKFMEKYGITAVKKESPNRMYRGEACHHAGRNAHWSIWTDGTVEYLSTDTGRTESWKGDRRVSDLLYEEQTTISVSGASYVILEQRIDSYLSKILYTEENLTVIANAITAEQEERRKREKLEKELKNLLNFPHFSEEILKDIKKHPLVKDVKCLGNYFPGPSTGPGTISYRIFLVNGKTYTVNKEFDKKLLSILEKRTITKEELEFLKTHKEIEQVKFLESSVLNTEDEKYFYINHIDSYLSTGLYVKV